MTDYGFVVVHIPHTSTFIPDEYRQTILLNDAELHNELAVMTDAFCDRLYDFPGVGDTIFAPLSRLVCDMERFRDDESEPCAKIGQGLMYTHTHDGKLLRKYDNALREKILAEYYDPHHARLTAAVDAALAKYGKCLIIDGHSFPDGPSMPDFDIGTDNFHTPQNLRDALCKRIGELGFSHLVNIPYSGTITPMNHYGKDSRVKSVMIETNRKLYQQPGQFDKTSDFEKVRNVCHQLIKCAANAGGF
ncbi:MAG: N-formylglutamate amidohydrolase [Firmicutes bacterium]|nr:N-formylglutamate amidohydrolase [Bacillota bacterium]